MLGPPLFYFYADKRAGGTLRRSLRCQKLRKKRYGGHDRGGTILIEVSIDKQ